ncbi:hypothetical protein Nepgr_011733 [Nepenthes gracilis]|uniref:Uncharacterized protein n=1 Tax=Nepenthes gracilis TaxID=150966 RepID=A0AAD3SEX5_NEPGR|nr:hypothetical protein Nepgr_011733 [Nepenthes gracilis]
MSCSYLLRKQLRPVECARLMEKYIGKKWRLFGSRVGEWRGNERREEFCGNLFPSLGCSLVLAIRGSALMAGEESGRGGGTVRREAVEGKAGGLGRVSGGGGGSLSSERGSSSLNADRDS